MYNEKFTGEPLTVLQVSKVCNKSRRTIYNYIDKMKEEIKEKEIGDYIVYYNDILHLTLKGQAYIYKELGLIKLLNSITEDKETEKDKSSKSDSTDLIEFLKEQIKVKDEDIKEKNNQLAEKDKQIANLQAELSRQTEINLIHTQTQALNQMEKNKSINANNTIHGNEAQKDSKKIGFFEWIKEKFN